MTVPQISLTHRAEKGRVVHHRSSWTFFQAMSIISVYKTSPPPHSSTPLPPNPGLSFLDTMTVYLPHLLCLEALRRWMILGTPKATVQRLPPLPKDFTSILLTLHTSPTTPWSLSLPRNTPPLRVGLPNLWLWLSIYLPLHFLILLGSALHSPGGAQFSSVAQSCPTLCDPMDCSMPSFPVHHQLLELAQTHVPRVSDALQPSHPLLSPSPPAFSLSQHQGLFQWVSSLHQVAKVLEFQLQSFQWIFQDWFSLGLTGLISLQSKGHSSLLQHHCSKASILRCSAFFMIQLSHPYMTTGKTIAWTRWTFVGRVISLLFNMLFRLVIAFLPRVALVVKKTKNNLPIQEMQDTWVRSLGREDPLEKEMAAHSSIPAWRILWTEKPGRLQSSGLQRAGQNGGTDTFTFFILIRDGSVTLANCPPFYACCLHEPPWWVGTSRPPNVSDAHMDPEVPLSTPCSEATCQSLSLVTPSICSHLGKLPSNTLIGSLGRMEDFRWLLKTAQAFQPWLMHNHFLYSSCFYSTILPTFSHQQMMTPNTLLRPIWLEERMSMFFTSGQGWESWSCFGQRWERNPGTSVHINLYLSDLVFLICCKLFVYLVKNSWFTVLRVYSKVIPSYIHTHTYIYIYSFSESFPL